MEKGLKIQDLEKLLEESYAELRQSDLAKSKHKVKKAYKAEEEAEEKEKEKEEEKEEEKEAKERKKEEEKEEEAQKAEMDEAADMPAEDEEAMEAEELSDEELMQIYASMSPEELERHLKIAQAVASKMKEGAGAEAAPQAEAPAMEAQKAEKEFFNKLIKHLQIKDEEIQSLKGQLEELKKAVQLTTKAVLMQNKPIRKSVSGVEFIDRSGSSAAELTKAQIDERLAAKINSPSLTQSERDAINKYYLRGEVSETLKRLIS